MRTIASFRDLTPEFRALTTACAVYDLGWRAKIVVTGEDGQRWLNGMVTNNIKDLPVNRGNYNFLLNPQGRIQGDLYVYNRGEYLLLDTERSQVEALLKIFDHYIIMDDVELTDASEKITALGIQGPECRKVMKQAGIDIPELDAMQLVDLSWQEVGISVTRMASEDYETYEIWAGPANIAAIWNALLQAGATPVGAETLEKFRIMIGFPKYGADIRERDLPQETGQTHALNFSKGCYVGQEIVERIRSRGNVHRTFKGFSFAGEEPAPGTKLRSEGKEVGEITSIARVPSIHGSADRVLGLGYIRREALERKGRIEYDGGEAQPAEVPFSLQ